MSSSINRVGKLKGNKEVNVEWEIEFFFASVLSTTNSRLISPDFHFANATWYIQLNNKLSTTVEQIEWIGIYLLLHHNPKKEKIPVAYSLGIKCNKDLTVDSLSYDFEEENNGFGRAMFIKRTELYEKREKLVPGDTLTVFCKANISSLKEDGIKSSSENLKLSSLSEDLKLSSLSEDLKLSSLSEDLKNLFMNEKDYDATINVKEKLFRIHKVIVGSRSPVLSAMFQHDMKESNSNTVNIDDCDPEIFHDFLLFLYSGKAENLSPNTAARLYNLADKYIVQELKQICLDFMKVNMNLENICEIVILADHHNEKSLKEIASEWVKNNLKDIIRTDQWVTFLADNNVLAAELLKQAIPA